MLNLANISNLANYKYIMRNNIIEYESSNIYEDIYEHF